MPPTIRPARAADLDALVELETLAFASDRMSRRSFRASLDRPTSILQVAEDNGEVLGYFLVLFRRGSAMARLYSIAVSPKARGTGLGRTLLAAAEEAAFEAGRIVLRLEVREDNANAIRLYESNGYRHWGRSLDYYEDHATALRMEKLLRGKKPIESKVLYYPQSEEFTCGPACLLMALGHFQEEYVPSALDEIRIWREATTIFLLSGLGGCGPEGLALAASHRGLHPRVIVSQQGPLFMESVRSEDKRRVMELAQEDLLQRALAENIPIEYREWTTDDLLQNMEAGGLAILLISSYRMVGTKVPHWVLVIGNTGSHFVLHDPYVDPDTGENSTDTALLPVAHSALLQMARYGKQGLRALVLLPPPSAS
ncbi:MAG: GNAT family N-acetyltransferase/peptidase C39 family protein [Planctomycetota bacterium]